MCSEKKRSSENVCMNGCMVAFYDAQNMHDMHISVLLCNLYTSYEMPKNKRKSSKIKDSLKLLDFFMCINITGEEGVEPSRKVLKT